MPTDQERLTADSERRQRVGAAAVEATGLVEAAAQARGAVAAKLSPTATALQMAWRFYLPSFTLTSLYIFAHIVLRYVGQFKFFCPADQGSPLAGASAGPAGLVSGGVAEKVWIVLGLASVLPLLLALFLIYATAYTLANPFDAAVAAFSSVLSAAGSAVMSLFS